LNIGYRKEVNLLLPFALLKRPFMNWATSSIPDPAKAIIPLRGIQSIMNNYKQQKK
jgi:hypothetical protein